MSPAGRDVEDVAQLERLVPKIERAQTLSPEARDTINRLIARQSTAGGRDDPVASDAAQGGDRTRHKRDAGEGRHLDRRHRRGRDEGVTSASDTARPAGCTGAVSPGKSISR